MLKLPMGLVRLEASIALANPDRLRQINNFEAGSEHAHNPSYREAFHCDRNRHVRGSLRIETNVVSGIVDIAALADNLIALGGSGLGRQLSVYRLPEADFSRHVILDHAVSFAGAADLPVYLRVTQADGHQAWSSPIYLIA